MLTVLLLHQSGYDVGRYISLERLIEENKESYYEVLNRVSEHWHTGEHAILPWWQYSLGILVAAYREFEGRVGSMHADRGAKTLLVREAIDHLPDTFSIAEVIRTCPGVSRATIRVVLDTLRREGSLDVHATGRRAVWRKT